MQGSKNDFKKRRYDANYGRYLCYYDRGDFNRKIRRMGCNVDVPNGGYFKKVDTFFAWGD